MCSYCGSTYFSERRTNVLDDEADYFQVDNQWLSDKERTALKKKEQELREAKYGSRIGRGVDITLDIAGRQVTENEQRDIGIIMDYNSGYYGYGDCTDQTYTARTILRR